MIRTHSGSGVRMRIRIRLPTDVYKRQILTFTGDNPNAFVRDVTPSPDAVTIREHHSFVELPGPGYQPRAFDPRAGYIGMTYADFIAPLGDRYIKHLIIRHRLQKKDPSAAISDCLLYTSRCV